MVVLWYQCASATEFIERLAILKRLGKPVTLELLQQAAVPESLESPGRRKLLERVAASGPAQLLEPSEAPKFLEIVQHENAAKPLEELALKASEADLTFLISHNSRPLQSLRLKSNDKILLDGPYGQDLGLQHYQTVMLAARGAGISVLLSFALYLWERQGQGLLRKVNILWSLEGDYQEEWVSEKLKILKALDSLNVRCPHLLYVVDMLTYEDAIYCVANLPLQRKEKAFYRKGRLLALFLPSRPSTLYTFYD